MNEYGMVIVGSGEAGVRAAIELRNNGWKGNITLIGKEKTLPYERPPLSKDTLIATEEPIPVYIANQDQLDKNAITFIADNEVKRIMRKERAVVLADGQVMGYERLLLTTGAQPRKLVVEGAETSGVLYLRTFSDALKLRENMKPGREIVVIGGGFIGLEVAASAREKGCKVTLVEVGPRILMRGVPRGIADIVEGRHREAGVVFKLGVGINRLNRSAEGQSVELADGTSIPCDLVVAGIGAIPETALATECGLTIDNGISVNAFLETSDPYIFAAGDCCSFPYEFQEGKAIRLEAWRNAQDQGMVAARNMLGARTPYSEVPWFWSEQYELVLQVAGLLDGSEAIVQRDLDSGGRLYFHLAADGRLLAASGIGLHTSIAKHIRIAEMLIRERVFPDPADLANSGVKLKSLLKIS